MAPVRGWTALSEGLGRLIKHVLLAELLDLSVVCEPFEIPRDLG